MKILSLITHPHVVPNQIISVLCDIKRDLIWFETHKAFVSSSEHKLQYFWWNRELFDPLDGNVNDTFKAQKGSKGIVKIVHVTSVVQP